MLEEEQKYEAITIIVKARTDGQDWSDMIHDMIAAECQGCVDETGEVIHECTCGMEMMSATTATLEQCYRWVFPDWDDDEPDFRELTVDQEEG